MNKHKEHFLIWGAKGHAKVLNGIIQHNGDEIIAVIDINKEISSPFEGLRVIHGIEGYKTWLKLIKESKVWDISEISAIAAIGGNKGKDRMAYFDMFKRDGFKTPTLVHPKAYISDDAIIGSNSHFCAFSFVGSNAAIGNATILNTRASVDHECYISDGVHLAPGVVLCGCVTVGTNTFIGAGATVLPNIVIGENCIIGAGSVVTKDVPNNVLVYGNPARFIRNL